MTIDDTLKRPQRRTLGRGLGALLGEAAEDYAQLDGARPAKTSAVDLMHPGPFQPRRNFAPEAMADLAASIKEKGVLQPILVRRHPSKPSEFQIIAGERRWRAAQMAGLHEVPIVVREMSDLEALEVAIIENVQREDLTAVEEADGYQRLITEFGHTHDDLARVLSKSRAHITNTLRLLRLPEHVRLRLDTGEISAGHARAILAAPDGEALLQKILTEGLSVRAAEIEARGGAKVKARKARNSSASLRDPNTLAIEKQLSEATGLRVAIEVHGEGGIIYIRYQDLAQFDDIARRLVGKH